jgi:nucleoside-diphosphate-sugar epimerase
VKICLVGASGGIGRQLLTTFSKDAEVIAVYRNPPEIKPNAALSVARFDDGPSLAGAVASADVVVHAALNTRDKGQKFIDANKAVTNRLLSLIEPGQCRLFVYFSSQVVYAALDPKTHPLQSEDAELKDGGGLDFYTRLKLEEEEEVKRVCRQKGIDYLIVRPTVVMGPHMQWSSGIVQAMRFAPFGLKGRTINLIHVADLADQLNALIHKGVVNTVVNLGDLDVSSDDYFRHAAGLAKRPMFFAPNWMADLAGKAIPSTLWFFAHDVTVDSRKVRELTGVDTNRSLGEFFDPDPTIIDGSTLPAISAAAGSGRPFHTLGRGYSLWFNDKPGIDQLVVERYSGIVKFENGLLTVKAGTSIREMLAYLSRQNMTLATLPEFIDISAGACFFAEVHGSSSEHISIYDLIEAIRYVDETGVERESLRDDMLWDQLRLKTGTIVVTEVTFACRPAYLLGNMFAWETDDRLEHYVSGGYRDNFATMIHWYPNRAELLVYHINPVDRVEATDARPFAPMRGSPYGMQKRILGINLRGKTRVAGLSERILAPWTGIPAKAVVGRFFKGAKAKVRNMEVCVSDTLAPELIARLRKQVPEMRLGRDQGIGVRFTRSAETGHGFVWVETTSSDASQMHAIVRITREVAGDQFWLHRGKYVPPGIEAKHLFIARAPLKA